MTLIDQYQSVLDKKQALKTVISDKLLALDTKKAEIYQRKLDLIVARGIFQKAAQLTQSKLEHDFSALVTMALKAVFDDPYEFRVKFVERRNVTECDLMFVRNEQERDPLDSCGFGASDVAAFASLICYLELIPNVRRVLVLDEPFRNLSVDLQSRASAMIQLISEKRGWQFIIISHVRDLARKADKELRVQLVNDVSQVRDFEHTAGIV